MRISIWLFVLTFNNYEHKYEQSDGHSGEKLEDHLKDYLD